MIISKLSWALFLCVASVCRFCYITPMLTTFRRHTRKCAHRKKGRSYKYCSCPIAVEGTLGSDYIRKSLNTFNWEVAAKLARDMESAALFPTEKVESPTIENAIEDFLADCRERELAAATIYKYEILTKQLNAFANDKGLKDLSEMTAERVKQFRLTWKDKRLSAYKKNERLRTFFKFFQKYMENPVPRIGTPKEKTPIKTFTDEQIEKLLEACGRYSTQGIHGATNRDRIRAFILLMRYSGLRISDATTLRRDKIDKKGSLYLRTTKNSTDVWLPLPPDVIDALHALPKHGEYFFWTGNGQAKAAAGDWQRSLSILFKLAGVKGHSHMFRHTFATELLTKGVSIETVAEILGNSSAIVRKHYRHFSAVWQNIIETAVKQTWTT